MTPLRGLPPPKPPCCPGVAEGPPRPPARVVEITFGVDGPKIHLTCGIGHHVPRHQNFMFLDIMTSCSLAVRTMRACAQAGSAGPCPPGGGSGGRHTPQWCHPNFGTWGGWCILLNVLPSGTKLSIALKRWCSNQALVVINKHSMVTK